MTWEAVAHDRDRGYREDGDHDRAIDGDHDRETVTRSDAAWIAGETATVVDREDGDHATRSDAAWIAGEMGTAGDREDREIATDGHVRDDFRETTLPGLGAWPRPRDWLASERVAGGDFCTCRWEWLAFGIGAGKGLAALVSGRGELGDVWPLGEWGSSDTSIGDDVSVWRRCLEVDVSADNAGVDVR